MCKLFRHSCEIAGKGKTTKFVSYIRYIASQATQLKNDTQFGRKKYCHHSRIDKVTNKTVYDSFEHLWVWCDKKYVIFILVYFLFFVMRLNCFFPLYNRIVYKKKLIRLTISVHNTISEHLRKKIVSEKNRRAKEQRVSW